MRVLLGLKGGEAECKVSVKIAGLNLAPPLKLAFLSAREVCGMRCVAVKCIDITQNSDCEGSIPAPN